MRPDARTSLYDIAQAGDRLSRFIAGRDWEQYQADELLRAGVERQFEIIGEALNQLRRHFPDLAARIADHEKIIGFRNILIHGYAVVDDAVVWSAATEKLPRLLADVRALSEALAASDL
jgi:uncharacterized protein with HEPN domain